MPGKEDAVPVLYLPARRDDGDLARPLVERTGAQAFPVYNLHLKKARENEQKKKGRRPKQGEEPLS